VECETVEGHTHSLSLSLIHKLVRMQTSSHRRTAMRHEHLGPVTESDISDRVSLGSTCANSEQTPRTCRAARTISFSMPVSTLVAGAK
jgi:hypothetical protein